MGRLAQTLDRSNSLSLTISAQDTNPMRLVISFLDYKAYNQAQRVGAFVAIVVFLLILILHNPMFGYETEEWISCVGIPDHLCPKKPFKLGPMEWRSNGAMIESMKPLGSALLTVAALLVAIVAWLNLFRTKVD